jgi:hypothetical protein
MDVKIATEIQHTRISIGNRLFSFLSEAHIRGHPQYEKLLQLRKDKKADRKETAKFTKKILQEQLKTQGLTMEQFTEEFEATKKNYAPYQLLVEAEKVAFKKVEPTLKTTLVFVNWMQHVKGLGPRLSAQLLMYVRDIQRFPNPSKMRKYMGLVPAMKKRRGQEAHFVPELKGLMLGKIGQSFMKSGSPYKKIYDEKKKAYQENHADWTKGKIHNYALKAMVNRFAVELWLAWHMSEGREPPCNPYITLDPKHKLEPLTVAVQFPEKPERT